LSKEPDKKKFAFGFLRELRFLFKYRGHLYRSFKFISSREDASIYIVVYGCRGRYYYGLEDIPEKTTGFEFELKDLLERRRVLPKISIHESGQVHIKVGLTSLAGPLSIPALSMWRGGHLATIRFDSFEGLPEHDGIVRTKKTEKDVVLEVPEQKESARIALWVNGLQPTFDDKCFLTRTTLMPGSDSPIYLGFSLADQKKFSMTGETGVMAVAGWDPRKMHVEPQKFLFLKAE